MKKIIIAVILIFIVCFTGWVLLADLITYDENEADLQNISQTLQTYRTILEDNPTPQQLIEIKTGLNQIETKLTEIETKIRGS